MSMTPKDKALQLRQLARDKQAAQEREAELADQQAIGNIANELMCKALSPLSGEANTFGISCKRRYAERVIAILVANGFTKENFWEVSYQIIEWNAVDYIQVSVILT